MNLSNYYLENERFSHKILNASLKERPVLDKERTFTKITALKRTYYKNHQENINFVSKKKSESHEDVEKSAR